VELPQLIETTMPAIEVLLEIDKVYCYFLNEFKIKLALI